MRYCLELGCSQVVKNGRCREHQRIKARSRPDAKQNQWYRRADWIRLRDQVRQEEPLCRHCLEAQPKRIEPTTQIDHITPHHGDRTLFLNRENCQGLCDSCHARKSRTEAA